jgi:acyl carrier protein phosphodiesterase
VNFLAHLHLSDGTPGSMVGGVVADFVRGPDVAALPADVQEGVRLHRLIDGFTDRHPVVQRSISRIAEKLGWFSGIVVDIYYDHILGRDWERYSGEPLATFAARANIALESRLSIVPDESRRFLRGFIDENRLLQYAAVPGISDTLSRVSDRIGRRIPSRAMRLESAMPDLLARHDLLASDFHAFYPELVAFASGCRPS